MVSVSKTHKRLKERFLNGRNRTKRAIFQATYNRKTEEENNKNNNNNKTINSTYLVSVGFWMWIWIFSELWQSTLFQIVKKNEFFFLVLSVNSGIRKQWKKVHTESNRGNYSWCQIEESCQNRFVENPKGKSWHFFASERGTSSRARVCLCCMTIIPCFHVLSHRNISTHRT